MTAEKAQLSEQAQDRFQTATGSSIGERVDFLRSHPDGATDLHDLTNRDIARLAREGDASDWSAQSIAVEVERIIGRRKEGQTVTGFVNAGASKTVPGKWTEVFELFVVRMAAGGCGLLPADPAGEPQTSATEKWRYWRIDLDDGSAATLDCSDASQEGTVKTRLSMRHEKLPTLDLREQIKAHWRGVLPAFVEELAR